MDAGKKFEDLLKEKIGDFENQTTIEFVPVMVQASDTYRSARLAGSLMVGWLIMLGFEILQPTSKFLLHWNQSIVAGIIAASLVEVLWLWKAFFRRFMPKRMLQETSLKAAHLSFAKNEIFLTRHRTGALVFVSILERQVWVLADKGLVQKIPESEFQALGQTLAQGFQHDRPQTAFFEALKVFLEKFAPLFPVGHDNPDELSNHLRRN